MLQHLFFKSDFVLSFPKPKGFFQYIESLKKETLQLLWDSRRVATTWEEFPSMSHGFVPRGNLDHPTTKMEVARAMEMLGWLGWVGGWVGLVVGWLRLLNNKGEGGKPI